MKSVFPSVTDMMRRPRIESRNPRATVSTSGSSGISVLDQTTTSSDAAAFALHSERRNRGGENARNLIDSILVIVRIRRMIRNHHGIFLERVERDLHGLLKLRVVSPGHGRRIVFHFDVGCDSVVLYFPLAVQSVDRTARRGDRASIQQRWIAPDAHQAAPGARPDQRADFVLLEHPRQRITAGT